MTRQHQFPELEFDQISIQPPEKEDELLSIPQAAKFLAISVSGMRRLQSERRVAFFKIGRSVRIARKDLEAYVAKRRVGAVEA